MADYQRQKKGILAMLLAVSLFIPWLLSAITLFLSIWIIVPAPTFFLLPLGVGAPEISPWLIGGNVLALILILFKVRQSWLYNIALIASLLGLLISLLPLLQFPSANTQIAKEMQSVLGTDYLAKIPQTAQVQMRRQPFVLADAFRGIPQAEVRIERHITFANPDNVKLTLNVYRPLATGKHPTIIMIYGGAWRSGTPNNDEKFSCYMASQGYSVIAIDYRHAPKYKFPVQLEDVKTALSYIQTHADSLSVDGERIALMGRSAGAHLAMLASYQMDTIPVKAVINYYGPVNLTKGYYDPPFPNPINTRDVLLNFLGGTPKELGELYQQASPINYIRPNLPPSLLIYAGRDHIVKSTFGRQLYEKLQGTGNDAIWVKIPWAEHAFDAVFNGVSNQLALYYTERFLAWALKSS
ncbi:alpha/beta hydrolase fold domain-containing protein [Aerosakkonemataceae cyanobacterium BLCC-F50]|uniref:Alpha/beta hydrolase fold domain-containing protein n=1 Tax=Floridaenema flaviceps BLCC-F50 TaxID=3153642 RepID=A0ABV4Y3A4_9CYAN